MPYKMYMGMKKAVIKNNEKQKAHNERVLNIIYLRMTLLEKPTKSKN